MTGLGDRHQLPLASELMLSPSVSGSRETTRAAWKAAAPRGADDNEHRRRAEQTDGHPEDDQTASDQAGADRPSEDCAGEGHAGEATVDHTHHTQGANQPSQFVPTRRANGVADADNTVAAHLQQYAGQDH